MKAALTPNERGRQYELKIEKLTRKALGLEIKRDSKSGAGQTHKQDIRDRFRQLPLFLECKNQATLKPREWFRDARSKAAANEYPTVVFPGDSDADDLCLMSYADVLQLVKEAMDWKAKADDLAKPAVTVEIAAKDEVTSSLMSHGLLLLCKDGHVIPAGRDKCQVKGCKYSSTYKATKKDDSKK